MSPASSTGREFSRSSPARRLNAWSSAASFLAAWFSSSKPLSVPSKAVSVKSASSAAPRPTPCCWLRTRRKHPPMREWPRSLEHASSVCLCPPRKRLFRLHDGYFVQKEVSVAFRAQAPLFVCTKEQTRYAPARCREVPSAYLQAPARGHDPRPRRLHLRRHWQEVSGFSWRYRRECARPRAHAHREGNPPRSGTRHSPLEPISQCLPGPARLQTCRMVRPRSRVLRQQRHGSARWRAQARAALWTPAERGCRDNREEASLFGLEQFFSWPHLRRHQRYFHGKVPLALRARRPRSGVRAFQRRR